MQDLRRALATIRSIARTSQGQYALREVLRRICAEVAQGYGFDRVAIARFDASEGVSIPLAGHGLPDDAFQARPRLEESRLLERACRLGELVYVADARREPSLPPEVIAAYGVTSIFAVPLLSEDSCIGFLAGDRAGTPFALSEIETDVLNTIGALAATILEKELVREELRRLDEAKTQFIALASHELRTPIQTVYGIISTLHHRGGELSEEQLVELRAAAYTQAVRLRQLTEQLLDLSRIDADAVRLDPRPLPLRRKVEEIVLSVAERDATAITIEIAPDLEPTLDELAIDRITSNLLGNALRYGSLPVTVAAAEEDRHFRLRVEDRGPGVAPNFLPDLFERFTRSQQSAAKSYGSGLGLSIARAYARAHGGEIIYRAAKPRGACFELVIPRLN